MAPNLNLSLSHSIRSCRQLTAQAHSNFVPAFALLPAAKRQAMEILYACTRFTDDIADLPDASPVDTTEISLQRKKEKLCQWVGALEAVLGKRGEENVPQIEPTDEQAFQHIAGNFPGCAGVIFLPALKMIVDKFSIPRESLFHLVEGIEWDMDPKPFATFDDSVEYCHCVATSVGFASLAIWGTTKPLFSKEIVRAAKACGVAFQWTNIVRDMREDYQNGRIYLPQSELQRFGLTDKQFGSILIGADEIAPKNSSKQNGTDALYTLHDKENEMENVEEKFFQLIAHQLHRCEIYYDSSMPLYHLIHRDSRRAFGLMWNYYHSIYQKMCSTPWRVIKRKRVQLSLYEKMRLYLRWRFLPCRLLSPIN